MITVVHCNKEEYDVYIGRKNRGFHFGNPFTHLSYGLGSRKVKTRRDAIQRFKTWLDGTSDVDVEPERRQWILDNLPSLRGKTLGCYCKPLACHGDILATYERDSDDKQSELPGFAR